MVYKPGVRCSVVLVDGPFGGLTEPDLSVMAVRRFMRISSGGFDSDGNRYPSKTNKMSLAQQECSRVPDRALPRRHQDAWEWVNIELYQRVEDYLDGRTEGLIYHYKHVITVRCDRCKEWFEGIGSSCLNYAEDDSDYCKDHKK